MVPQDAIEEFVHKSASSYKASTRRVHIPDGYKFQKLWAHRNIDNYGWNPQKNRFDVKATVKQDKKYVTVDVQFPEQWSEYFYSTFHAVFTQTGKKTKMVKFLVITPATAIVSIQKLRYPGAARTNVTMIPFSCRQCHLQGIVVRTSEGQVHNVDPSMYSLQQRIQKNGELSTILEIMIGNLSPQEYGDFYALIKNANGVEERVKVLEMQKKAIKLAAVDESIKPGTRFDKTIGFECEGCELTDVMCNGESAVSQGLVSIMQRQATVSFPRFDDSQACVYTGLFILGDQLISKRLMTVERVDVKKLKVGAPKIGEPYETKIKFNCQDCFVQKVTINGMDIKSEDSRRSSSSTPSYVATSDTITIKLPEFTSIFEGQYQAVFNIGGEPVTKNIVEIGGDGGDDIGGEEALAASEEEDNGEHEEKEDGAEASTEADADASTEAGAEGAEEGAEANTEAGAEGAPEEGADASTEAGTEGATEEGVETPTEEGSDAPPADGRRHEKKDESEDARENGADEEVDDAKGGAENAKNLAKDNKENGAEDAKRDEVEGSTKGEAKNAKTVTDAKKSAARKGKKGQADKTEKNVTKKGKVEVKKGGEVKKGKVNKARKSGADEVKKDKADVAKKGGAKEVKKEEPEKAKSSGAESEAEKAVTDKAKKGRPDEAKKDNADETKSKADDSKKGEADETIIKVAVVEDKKDEVVDATKDAGDGAIKSGADEAKEETTVTEGGADEATTEGTENVTNKDGGDASTTGVTEEAKKESDTTEEAETEEAEEATDAR